MTEGRAGYAKPRSRFLQWLLRSPLVALAVAWTFQGMLYMDPTERRFKLVLDFWLTAGLGLVLSTLLQWYIAWPLAFAAAHSLNFLFNGELWGVLKHYGFIEQQHHEFDEYVQAFCKRAQHEPAVDYVLVCGSVARDEWSPQSDLDVRLVRVPGFLNGLRACWFLLYERTRALFAGFPLDAYVLDGEASLQKLRLEERPEVGTEECER